MFTLRIEHAAPDYDGWKRAFDSDPAGRQRSGARRYRISRPTDDPSYVMIDLDFDSKAEAEGLLAWLRPIWARLEGSTIRNPQARIVEVVESKEV